MQNFCNYDCLYWKLSHGWCKTRSTQTSVPPKWVTLTPTFPCSYKHSLTTKINLVEEKLLQKRSLCGFLIFWRRQRRDISWQGLWHVQPNSVVGELLKSTPVPLSAGVQHSMHSWLVLCFNLRNSDMNHLSQVQLLLLEEFSQVGESHETPSLSNAPVSKPTHSNTHVCQEAPSPHKGQSPQVLKLCLPLGPHTTLTDTSLPIFLVHCCLLKSRSLLAPLKWLQHFLSTAASWSHAHHWPQTTLTHVSPLSTNPLPSWSCVHHLGHWHAAMCPLSVPFQAPTLDLFTCYHTCDWVYYRVFTIY